MDYITREEKLVVSGLDIVVREQDGNAEDILFQAGKDIHKALPQYWASLTVSLGDNEKVRKEHLVKLRSHDLDQIAIAIYRAGSPDDSITLTGACPGCRKPINVTQDMDNLDFMPIPDGKKGPDPIFELVTRRGNEIVWGYITGEEEFAQFSQKGFDASRRVWKAIRSINGKTDISLRDVLALPIACHHDIRQHMQEKRCGYDTRIAFEHTCGYEGVANLLTDPSFLLPGIPSPTGG